MREEVEQVLASRQNDYGDAEANLTAIGRSWGSILRIEDIPAWKVGLMMDALKTIRITQNPGLEREWDDKEGYTHHSRAIIAKSKIPLPPEIDD